MGNKRLEARIKLPYRESSIDLSQTEDRSKWDMLLTKSPQFNVFMTSNYLFSLETEFSLYLVSQGDSYIGGFIDFLEFDFLIGENASSFCTYQSFFFCHELSMSSANNLELEVMYAVTSLLLDLNVNFNFSVHHSIQDSRAFDWLNFDRGKTVVALSNKYTGIIDLRAVNSSNLLDLFKPSRRSELLKSSAKITLSHGNNSDIATFMKLYENMFTEKGIPVSIPKLRVVRRIVETSQSSETGVLTLATDVESNEIVGATFIQSDAMTSYYQFACANQRGKVLNSPTLLMASAIEESLKRGAQWFDVVGMNSPKRGFFKSTFGAIPRRYFEVSNAE